jgi:hypothetical protein
MDELLSKCLFSCAFFRLVGRHACRQASSYRDGRRQYAGRYADPDEGFLDAGPMDEILKDESLAGFSADHRIRACPLHEMPDSNLRDEAACRRVSPRLWRIPPAEFRCENVSLPDVQAQAHPAV